MPTGYTDAIKDGISFREYALHCSRAFGALVLMRDEPMDAEIPQIIEPSDFHSKNVKKYESELIRIKSLSVDEACNESKKEFDKKTESYHEAIKKYRNLEEKYSAMLVHAEAYQPPSPDHIEYKKFMVSQIEESIKFDCNYSPSCPKLATGDEWKEKKEKQLLRDIEYHKKENSEEMERAENRTKWVQQMLDSLPAKGGARRGD